MRRLLTIVGLLASGVLLAAPSVASAATGPASADPRATLTGIRADVSCHDPCDDPFQLRAWVAGSGVGGLVVRFTVDGRAFRARTSSGGYAHYHLDVNPSDYPQGVVVSVRATVTHGGVSRSATTWFKPNYQ